MIEYLEGLLKIANVFLSVVAGIIAITLFKVSEQKKNLKPWNYLIIVLVLFAVQMILGALRAFEIFESPYLTHIIPTIMLAFLIIALILQIQVQRACAK